MAVSLNGPAVGNQSPVSGAPTRGQAAYMMRRLDAAAGHTSMLILSDSTGNAPPTGTAPSLDYSTAEWPAFIGKWLSEKYPTYTTRLRYWNIGTLVWGEPIALTTGTTAFNLDVWVLAASGTRPDYALGAKYATAVASIVDTTVYTDAAPEISLLVLNHGHNITGMPSDQIAAQNYIVGAYAQTVEEILTTHTAAGVICIAQNPDRNNSDNDSKALMTRLYAARRGFDVADVWSRFISANKSPALYADSKHPSIGTGGTGTDLFSAAVRETMDVRGDGSQAGNRSWFLQYSRNILPNGGMTTWTTSPGAPDGWTAQACTAEKDLTLFDSPKLYSAKVTGSGTGQPFLRYQLSTGEQAAVLGKWITLAVRVYVPTGQASSVGRIGLLTSSNSTNTSTPWSVTGGWIWRFLSVYVKPADTYVRVQLYADTATNSTASVYFDRAILVFGQDPRDGL